MPKDWTGNSHSFASMLGARNYAKNEREQHDFYATDPRAIDDLLKYETFNKKYMGMCCWTRTFS